MSAAISKPSFDDHCLALGKLCVAWAFIDRQMNDLVQAMLGCSQAAAASVSTIADSVAARTKIIRLLNAERPISVLWTDAFDTLLKELDRASQTRNRFIHDRWELTPAGLVRIDRRASARRSQSRKPVVLDFDTEHATPPEAVEALTATIGKIAFGLHCALRDQEDWRRASLLASPPLLIRAGDLEALPDVIQLLGLGQ